MGDLRTATNIILDVELRSTSSSAGKSPRLVTICAGHRIGSSYRLAASPRISDCIDNSNDLRVGNILDLDDSFSTTTRNTTR